MKKFEGESRTLWATLSRSPPPQSSKNHSERASTNGALSRAEIESEHDLLAEGGQPGTIPTDLEQSTGLERLEILGKMQGIDVFDMRPLDSSRKGSLDNPIVVKSYSDEQYLGCTGCPADTHVVIWLTTSRDRPIERCPECGSVYKLDYVGPQESHDAHGHDHGHGARKFARHRVLDQC